MFESSSINFFTRVYTFLFGSHKKLFKTFLGKKYNIFSPKIKREEERREKNRRGIRRIEKGKPKKKILFHCLVPKKFCKPATRYPVKISLIFVCDFEGGG